MSVADAPGGRPKRTAAIKRNYKEVEDGDDLEPAENIQTQKKQKKQFAQRMLSPTCIRRILTPL